MMSQVITPAIELSKYIKVEIIKEKLRDFDNINRIPVTTYGNLFELKNKLLACDYVYVRGIYSFLKAYLFQTLFGLNFKIIYDFRALVHEESYFRNKSHFRKYFLRNLEVFGLKNADMVTAVSNNLKKELNNLYQRKDKITVIPCGIQNVYKKSKKIAERGSDFLSFVYLGSLSKWQCFDEMVNLYYEISKYFNSHLTVITRDVKKAKNILAEKNITNTVMSLSHSEVQAELRNHDFGFLLRKRHIVNKVASPVKFLEYTSNGVIPILSPGVGDYSQKVKNLDLGIIWENKIQKLIEDIQKKRDNEDIYNSLFEFSKKYQWESLIKKHPVLRRDFKSMASSL